MEGNVVFVIWWENRVGETTGQIFAKDSVSMYLSHHKQRSGIHLDQGPLRPLYSEFERERERSLIVH